MTRKLRKAKPRLLVGIDPSSKKLAAGYMVEGWAPKVITRDIETRDVPERAARAYQWAYGFARKHAHDHDLYVFIEKPVAGRNVGATIVQAEVGGAVMAGMKIGGAVYIEQVNVSTWKKRVVGNGNAGKPLVREFIKDTWPYYASLAGTDQDLYDAGAILRYGEQMVQTLDKINSDMNNDKE